MRIKYSSATSNGSLRRQTEPVLQHHEIERVLAVMAHPDDVDFGAAGTIANLTDAGVEVVYCLVTDGQAGGFDRTIERDAMARIRRREQTDAAAKVKNTDHMTADEQAQSRALTTERIDLEETPNGAGCSTCVYR